MIRVSDAPPRCAKSEVIRILRVGKMLGTPQFHLCTFFKSWELDRNKHSGGSGLQCRRSNAKGAVSANP